MKGAEALLLSEVQAQSFAVIKNHSDDACPIDYNLAVRSKFIVLKSRGQFSKLDSFYLLSRIVAIEFLGDE